nr:glutamyl aminopeptidase-like isoform X1 [Onthophagus taurus]
MHPYKLRQFRGVINSFCTINVKEIDPYLKTNKISLGFHRKQSSFHKSFIKSSFWNKTPAFRKDFLPKQSTIALGISTTILGVDNTSLKDDLDSCKSEEESTTDNPTTTEPTPEEDMTDYRLPKNVVPKTYDLYLYPDLVEGLYNGKVTIAVDVSEETSIVKIHSNGLNIDSVEIDSESTQYEKDELHELIVLKSSKTLTVGSHVITIEYNGDMRNRIVGLYVSKYVENGVERAMATSKFEPTYARQAFPCFDEPQMKAKFTVHLLIPGDDEKYIALSNMNQDSTERVDNGVLVTFKPSESMSTYLACFIVSDFAYKETSFNDDKVPLRVYATPGQLDKTDYALSVGKGVIEYFNGYFGLDYPLPKLDMAAIPDFVSGAMEHWGLVTFRETALLYDSKISSTANKQRVATVISHELAHSWFGNLVTMNWWNDLWLNEGFASYIEYKGVDAVEPTWNMMDQFVIEDLHNVLKIDSALSSHPIVQTVLTPDEITSIFDTISYSKGASVLRMLENAVTENVFKTGVTNYLNKYKFGNAVTDDFWNELEDLFNDVNVTEFMNTWTMQMGYPVLTVKSDGNKYTLTQKRYLTDQSKAEEAKAIPYNYKWIIPITYVTDKGVSTEVIWLHPDDESVTIEKPSDATWLKFNSRQVGYYRVNYEDGHWNDLINNIKMMDTVDRTHLIEETFRLAESGHISYNIPLDLSKKMADERDYVPWSAFSTVVGEVMRFLQNSNVYTNLQEYVSSLVEPAYKVYGFEEKDTDGHLDRRARSTVLNLACSAGMKECNEQASKLFKDWLDGTESDISQDLRQMVYIYGMKNSPVEYWDKLFDKFANEADAGEKLRLLYGLASIKDPSYLTKLIELASKDETYVRSQDYFSCLAYISYNTIGTPIVWEYVREHWEDLVDRFTLNERNLGTMIPTITQSFSSQTKLDEMEAFFAKYPNAGAGASARLRALETVRNNIKWLSQYKEPVEEWITALSSQKV